MNQCHSGKILLADDKQVNLNKYEIRIARIMEGRGYKYMVWIDLGRAPRPVYFKSQSDADSFIRRLGTAAKWSATVVDVVGPILVRDAARKQKKVN